MCRFELFLVILFLHTARNMLEWVLLVLREGRERLVVTDSGRVARPEWLVMLHGWRRLLARRSVWNIDILTDNSFIRVEELGLLGLL